jgi:hypothetical protein
MKKKSKILFICLRKTGDFNGRLPANRLKERKTKSFGRHNYTGIYIAENRLLISGLVFENMME